MQWFIVVEQRKGQTSFAAACVLNAILHFLHIDFGTVQLTNIQDLIHLHPQLFSHACLSQVISSCISFENAGRAFPTSPFIFNSKINEIH